MIAQTSSRFFRPTEAVSLSIPGRELPIHLLAFDAAEKGRFDAVVPEAS